MHILTNVHRGMYGKGYGLDPLHFGYKTEESLLNDKFSDLYLFKYTYTKRLERRLEDLQSSKLCKI